jgi:hypothetical protein
VGEKGVRDVLMSWKATVSALELPVGKLEKPSQWPLRVLVFVGAVLGLVYIFFLVQAYQSLLEAWQYNSWNFYWPNLGPVVAALSGTRLLELHTTLKKGQQDRASILPARQAAIAGDDTLAPLATPPDSLESDELQLSPDQMLHVHRPDDGRQLAYLVLGIILVVFGGLPALVMAIVIFTPGQPPGFLGVGVAIIGGITLLFLLPGLVLLSNARRERIVRIQLDGPGLSWRQGQRTRHANWQELQAFTTVHYQKKHYDKTRHDVFLLDASRAVVAWELTAKSSEAERSAYRYLCDQIAAHTSLRLRDLTEPIEKLQREAQAARASAGSTRVKMRAASVPTIAGFLPEPANPHLTPSRPSRKLALGCVGLLLLLLPAFLLYPLGWAAQHNEAHYFSALVGRVHAEPPLFQDPLAFNENEWCLQTPTKKDPEFYRYANSSYQMGGGKSSDYMDCWTKASYTNYAVEVTARQIGSDPQNDGVGLELRVGQDRMQVFVVDQEGYWTLWDYHDVSSNPNLDWTIVDQGTSSAVHQGNGTGNRLLAIVHGRQFILYVNNVYVATETVAGAQSSGDIGLISYDAALISAFTNFTVYPLPSLAPALPWGS